MSRHRAMAAPPTIEAVEATRTLQALSETGGVAVRSRTTRQRGGSSPGAVVIGRAYVTLTCLTTWGKRVWVIKLWVKSLV